MKKIALIDGDILLYRLCFALDKEKDVNAGFINWYIDKHINDLVTSSGCNDHRLFITWDNYRKYFATIAPYKGHRPDRPRLYDQVKTEFEKRAIVLDIPLAKSIEADDMMGIAASMLRERGVPHVICSIDKDLKQIQGEHYSWDVKGSLTDGKVVTVKEEDGLRYLYEQAMSGDPTDNIKGIKGYGAKKAKKALEQATTEREMFEAALEAYKAAGLETPLADLLENLNLVYIMQSEGFYRCPL